MGSKIRPLVKVKVFRTFEYTKSMLDKMFFMQDAISKSKQDMQTVINEIINNDHHEIGLEIFQFEATEEPGYRFRKPLPGENDHTMISINKAAKALTNMKMEAEHGPLNHELNPDIYIHEEQVIDERGNLLRNEAWYFKADIERKYYDLYDNFKELLHNVG